ncbi:cell envelope biogenesis protein TolA, partial [Litorisediminicola beolgyonensis]
MDTGLKVSLAGHGVVFAWLLFGGLFHSDPPEVTFQEVDILSESDFAALTEERAALPESTQDIAALPVPEPEPAPEPPAPEPAR